MKYFYYVAEIVLDAPSFSGRRATVYCFSEQDDIIAGCDGCVRTLIPMPTMKKAKETAKLWNKAFEADGTIMKRKDETV